MMNVQSVSTAAQQVSSKTTDATAANLDYNSFLKLLLQQLKSQDPTKPMDQTQMLSQLASFSNVGQTIQLNTKLAQLLVNSEAQTGAALVGKTITSAVDGTRGVVKSIEVTSSATMAVLASGAKFDLSGGFSING